MKFIKKYNNINKNEIEKLSNHIINEFNDYLNIVFYKNDKNRYNFYNKHYNKIDDMFLFEIVLLDYHYSETDRFFEFIQANSRFKKNMIEDEKNLSDFITHIMNMFNKNQNMIPFSNIDNIINELTVEKYELYLNSKKYNL